MWIIEIGYWSDKHFGEERSMYIGPFNNMQDAKDWLELTEAETKQDEIYVEIGEVKNPDIILKNLNKEIK